MLSRRHSACRAELPPCPRPSQDGHDISSIQKDSGRLKDFSPERGHSSRQPKDGAIGNLPTQSPRNLAGNTEKHDGNADLRVRFDHHCHPGFDRCHGRGRWAIADAAIPAVNTFGERRRYLSQMLRRRQLRVKSRSRATGRVESASPLMSGHQPRSLARQFRATRRLMHRSKQPTRLRASR